MGQRDVLLCFLVRTLGLSLSSGFWGGTLKLKLASSVVGGCDSDVDVLCDNDSALCGVDGAVLSGGDYH